MNRGTTLKWQYAEVPGVGHDGWAMYHTKADTADISTIAETLLFDTPYSPVPVFVPVAGFNYMNTGLIINFSDASLNTPDYWVWDFGDGDSTLMQNPVHTYSSSGTYYVCLTVGNSCVSDAFCDSVTVTTVGVEELSVGGLKFKVYPNPFNNTATIEISSEIKYSYSEIVFVLYNLLGRNVKEIEIKERKVELNSNNLSGGMYFYQAL